MNEEIELARVVNGSWCISKEQLDYFVNLEKENQQLKAKITELGLELEDRAYEQLKQENQQLKIQVSAREEVVNQLQNRIDKAITNIDILQEIIYQQPTDNQADDLWLLDKLDGIKNTLKGGKNE